MRSLLADIFRILFRIAFFRKRFFGIHKKIFKPLNLFRGIKKRIRLKNGIFFDLLIGDWVQENIFFLGEYEAAELRYVEKSIKAGDVFIDIGANIGLYTLHASAWVGSGGKVIAFEPLPQNFNSLKNNVSLNKGENITLENLAVGEKNGKIEIYYNDIEANSGMASAYLSEYSGSDKMDVVSLDKYFHQHPVKKIDFIKIDIEGGEYKALLGMKSTLSNYSPTLLIELNEEVLSKTPHRDQDIIDLLNGLGYHKHPVGHSGEGKNFAFIRSAAHKSQNT